MEKDNRAANKFLKENFEAPINEKLDETATLLMKSGVPMATAMKIARLSKELSLLCFWAGVDYAHLESL